MPRLSRRSFLAASAALVAGPAIVRNARAAADFDVAIIGAGAAGIAAARRIATAGRKCVVLEASDHVGGRCFTETRTFGVPYDHGAHWIYAPDFNPLTKLPAPRTIEVYPAPASQKVRIGKRYAREGELEDFLALQVRANRAIADAARKSDVSCERALPNDLGDWRPSIEFELGPFACGKDLTQVSAVDFAKSADRNTAAFCRQGFGALLATFAGRLPIRLSTPVTSIDTRRGITVTTPKGTIEARAVIVTASTNVIASGAIKFIPDLDRRYLDALAKLSLGSYDHIALELTGNPLGFESDDVVFEKATATRTAAILANVSGTPLCQIEVAGAFGKELASHGEAAMVDFAADWLAGLYGTEMKKAISRSHATRWNHNSFTLGAASAAAPGGQYARHVLTEPLQGALWFAGEAAHETLWGTVGGAWESGERAADAALRHLGAVKEAEPAPRPAPPRHHYRQPRM